jgi:hypothetical protein
VLFGGSLTDCCIRFANVERGAAVCCLATLPVDCCNRICWGVGLDLATDLITTYHVNLFRESLRSSKLHVQLYM